MHRGMPYASRLGLGIRARGNMRGTCTRATQGCWACMGSELSCKSKRCRTPDHMVFSLDVHVRCDNKEKEPVRMNMTNMIASCSLHFSCHRMHCQHHRRPALHSLVCQTCILFLSCATYLSVQAATSYSNGTYVMYTAVSACACCAARAGLSVVCSPAFWVFLSPPLLSSRMHSSLELLEHSCPQCLACTCIHV